MRKNVWEAAPPSDRWGEVYMALISMDDMEPCPEFSSLWARISETQKPKEFAELVLKYRNCLEDSISYIEDYGGERAKRATREMLLWASAAKAAEELAEFNDALIHGSGELPTYIHSILHEAEGLLVEAARHAGHGDVNTAKQRLTSAIHLIKSIILMDYATNSLKNSREKLERILTTIYGYTKYKVCIEVENEDNYPPLERCNCGRGLTLPGVILKRTDGLVEYRTGIYTCVATNPSLAVTCTFKNFYTDCPDPTNIIKKLLNVINSGARIYLCKIL